MSPARRAPARAPHVRAANHRRERGANDGGHRRVDRTDREPAFARDWQLSTLARDVDPAFLDTVVAETLKVPARVWHAAFSGFLTTPDCLAGLRRVSVPQARLIVHEGAGHAFHWEDPARAAAGLVAFVAGMRSTPAS